jgi:hypothetical protein
MKQPIELPIASMDKGDSFFVPCIEYDEVRREATRLSKDFNYDLRIERVVYNGLYGVRIWRI